jgi:hypothetical protein
MSHQLITYLATEEYVGILNCVARSKKFQTVADSLLTHIGWEAGWVPEPIWTVWRRDKDIRYSFNFGGYVPGNRFPPPL